MMSLVRWRLDLQLRLVFDASLHTVAHRHTLVKHGRGQSSMLFEQRNEFAAILQVVILATFFGGQNSEFAHRFHGFFEAPLASVVAQTGFFPTVF